MSSIPLPPDPPMLSRPSCNQVADGQSNYNFIPIRPDIEGMSEKYWGEILERTVSSGSLHGLQRSLNSPLELQQIHTKRPIQLTTSFNKNMNLNVTEEDNIKYSNSQSDPKLFEPYSYHDVSCAKNQRECYSFDEQKLKTSMQHDLPITAPDI